jgi:hypothetical protein
MNSGEGGARGAPEQLPGGQQRLDNFFINMSGSGNITINGNINVNNNNIISIAEGGRPAKPALVFAVDL